LFHVNYFSNDYYVNAYTHKQLIVIYYSENLSKFIITPLIHYKTHQNKFLFIYLFIYARARSPIVQNNINSNEYEQYNIIVSKHQTINQIDDYIKNKSKQKVKIVKQIAILFLIKRFKRSIGARYKFASYVANGIISTIVSDTLGWNNKGRIGPS